MPLEVIHTSVLLFVFLLLDIPASTSLSLSSVKLSLQESFGILTLSGYLLGLLPSLPHPAGF